MSTEKGKPVQLTPKARQAWAESFKPVLSELRAKIWARPPEQVASASGAVWRPEDSELRLSCLDEAYRVPWSDLVVYSGETAEAGSTTLQGLVLYYLSMAEGTPRAGQWISFRDLPDGWLYHEAFQGYSGDVLVERLGYDGAGRLSKAAAAIGGQKIEIGDAAYAFNALPRVQLAAVYWQGDEEFAPRAQVLFDATASHYLTTDGLAVLGSRLVHRLLSKVRTAEE
jgi:hypothetical protein